MTQFKYKTNYDNLKDKWTDENKNVQKSLWQNHFEALDYLRTKLKHSTVTSIGAFLLLATPVPATTPTPSQKHVFEKNFDAVDKSVFFVSDLSHVLPSTIGPLTSQVE